MKINPVKYQKNIDIVIIGSGVAGLMAANYLKNNNNIIILTNRGILECNTQLAQGGVAVVMHEEDNFSKHKKDTQKAGAGLCDGGAVEYTVKEGPGIIQDLIDMGACFDRNKEDGDLYFTREGAHSGKRVIHCHGDATGQEIEKTLLDSLKGFDNISFLENCPVIDLIQEDGIIKGIIFFNGRDEQFYYITANMTILATGGIGGLFMETSNFDSITGSGFGLAFKSGAVLRDMEFIQFHPTVFFQEGRGQRFLITEAMRGEGAVLLDNKGNRFMEYYHKDKELASRDIVSRAIYSIMKKNNIKNVFLDISHRDKDFIRNRFPGIYKKLLENHIDITIDLIPVKPAAHYIMGGVLTDIMTRTNLPGLLCCGECASTGVHGANRLASNSLLEGLVFGKRSAITAMNEKELMPKIRSEKISLEINENYNGEELEAIVNEIKYTLWHKAGIIRNEKSLKEGLDIVNNIFEKISYKIIADARYCELNNMILTSKAVFLSALRRRESIGGHFREDFPFKNNIHLQHTCLQIAKNHE